MVQKLQAEKQPLYSLISAPKGIWFVCTMFVHISLAKNLGSTNYCIFPINMYTELMQQHTMVVEVKK